MKLKEKISLEKVFEKEYKDKLVEPKSNKEAVITHFLHNSKNGVSQFFKKDAFFNTKENYFLGVPFGRAFRSNLFFVPLKKDFLINS